MTANITVAPEIPNASVKMTAVVKALARQRPRHAARMSWVTQSTPWFRPRTRRRPCGSAAREGTRVNGQRDLTSRLERALHPRAHICHVIAGEMHPAVGLTKH